MQQVKILWEVNVSIYSIFIYKFCQIIDLIIMQKVLSFGMNDKAFYDNLEIIRI